VVISVPDAEGLARRAHGTDRNKSGVLFIDHVRRVAERVQDDPDPYAVPAALLHDTVEKGHLDWDDLRAAGADDRLVHLVDALTERDDEPEEQYLARASSDPVALRIKRADIGDKLHGPAPQLTEQQRQLILQRARRRLDLLERLAAERR
jgi:(p)ppGpp synthase/HD superfamily hydrolase